MSTVRNPPGGQDAAPAPDRQIAALKLPPHSIEAEQSLIGGLLLDNSTWDRVGDQVNEADFYRDDHRRIFRHIARLIETGKPEERTIVAGLYSNRLKQGIMLQADPTIIYPITKGKPLGRRIRQSEIQAVNDYNTYSMVGLPKGPITNPGRASIEAVLNPAKTDALYMVADGTGGHAFAATLEEHNANVEKWYTIRKERGDF